MKRAENQKERIHIIYKSCVACEGTGEEEDGSYCHVCNGYGRVELSDKEYDELYMIDNEYN
jgi:DnaJ-class molecular chaperone